MKSMSWRFQMLIERTVSGIMDLKPVRLPAAACWLRFRRIPRRSQISIATGRRGFLEENLSGCPEAEARAGAVIE